MREKCSEFPAFRPIRGTTVPKSPRIGGRSGTIPYAAEQGDFSAHQGNKVPCSAESRDIARLMRRPPGVFRARDRLKSREEFKGQNREIDVDLTVSLVPGAKLHRRARRSGGATRTLRSSCAPRRGRRSGYRFKDSTLPLGTNLVRRRKDGIDLKLAFPFNPATGGLRKLGAFRSGDGERAMSDPLLPSPIRPGTEDLRQERPFPKRL